MYRKFCSNSLKSYLMDLILLIWYYKIMIIDSNIQKHEFQYSFLLDYLMIS